MQDNNGKTPSLTGLLDVLQSEIVPLTRTGVAKGNKVFGAAILRKSDLSLVVAGTNNEMENPLWHGEVHTLKLYYELPADSRPAAQDCVFLSTHEPCSLCLSAITWAGFDNFYYLFGYTDTDKLFNIPHDLKILSEVFGVNGGEYVRNNAFWDSFSIPSLVAELSDPEESAACRARIDELTKVYAELSSAYQDSKDRNSIPLA